VLITARVQRQVVGLFVAEDRGRHELKGVPEQTTLFRIVRASGGRRFGARVLTPLVGREEELDLLRRRWERAAGGEGQFVQIVGEPGIGKSRLVEEFRLKLGETPHTWAEFSSSQLLQNTPLHPIAEWGRQRFAADEPAARRLADLENTLRLIGLDASEYAPLLAPLVDIPLPVERAPKLAPEELRRRQLAALTAWFLAGARSQPVALAFEDLHWADPTSLDLLRALVERGAQAPLLIVATTRPEFRPDWSLRSHHSVISLAPLDRAQVRKMVGEIASRHALSDEIIDGVGERTGGVPLFVEEVTRLLLERDAQGGAQAIPPTLQQSLAARLDRLGPAREIAQIGAVLGRDFAYALLRDVAEIAEPALQASLGRLADADLLFVEGAPPEAKYRFKHALIQDAAYEGLLKSRRQALHRRAAEALREANAEPEAIAHHFTEAGLDDLAIEWWGKAGDQALRRSAFQEAIAHLGKAIAMADKAGETSRREPGRMAAVSQRLPQLHAAYGNALIAARGHGAQETIEAFARARKSASGDGDAPERLAADYGLWVGSYVRGDLPSMRTHAAAFLAGVAASPDSPEAGVAHRVLGTTHCFAGEYAEAREHLERALTLFQPGRDDDLAFRFGQDAGVAAMCYLAIASWPLGNVGRAVSLIDGAHERLASVAHIGTHPYAKLHAAMFELVRGDRARAAENGSETARLAREHDLPLWRAYGAFFEGLATSERGALSEGLSDMRRSTESLRQQNLLNFDGLFKIALAETEARAGDRNRAIAILDEALATVDRLGYRAFEAELHRARGEVLLMRDPANPAPAEEAFQSAIAVATAQRTRSFGLRAALALARLYESTRRSVEAHAALAPALEGFAPTPEMPEIAEGQALLAGLEQSDEVKAEAVQRRRMAQLRVAYGSALSASRGYGAPETTEALQAAREAASGREAALERLLADYGLWAASYVRGDLVSMRARAAAFLREIEAMPDSPALGVAHRLLGTTHWHAGEYVEARNHLERALALFEPGRDDELAYRFGQDLGVQAMLELAIVLWQLGHVERALSLVGRAEARIAGLAHVPSRAYGKMRTAQLALMRGDASCAASSASELASLARDYDLSFWRLLGVFFEGWVKAESGAPAEGLDDMRRAAELMHERNVLSYEGLLGLALGRAEARAGNAERSIAVIDEMLASCERTGGRAQKAELHRLRGENLLQRHPGNPAPAEEAFRTAVTIAKEQGARSWGLRAALSLAKLYQSTNRLADAHDVLAPALQGFSPTPEMPEIAEAQALFAALATDERVREALEKRQARAKMHIDYARAMQWAKGWGSEEARAAVERAHEFADAVPGNPEFWSLTYGWFAGSLLRGEFRAALEIAETYLRQAEAEGRPDHAVNARRLLGTVKFELGIFFESRQEFEKLVADWNENRDKSLRAVTGADVLCVGCAYMAQLMIVLGNVEDAVRISEGAIRRAESLGDFGSLAFALGLSLFVLAMCGRTEATLRRAEAFEANASEKGARLWVSIAREWASWARGLITDDAAAAANEFRDIMAARRERQERQGAYLGHGLLAQLQGRAGAIEDALASIAEGLALAEQTGGHRADSFLHRVRGDILAERDPAAAEAAYREAVRIAQSQGARTFELQAAHALAKILDRAGRRVEANAVLAPALEGFSPTPEMPEIAEAVLLVSRLA
jgi:tetratricopeptide (TPR) repeat protein